MKIRDISIEGLKIIELDFFKDERGFFVERYNKRSLEKLGFNVNFVQDNHSRSVPRVLRGLHFQVSPPQGKLVGVLSGAIWDVAIDIRPNSSTYLKYEGVELTEGNGQLLWIPPGFAHGFCVLGDKPADVFYKTDNFYSAQGDRSIRWDDPHIGIKWPINSPIVSEKDRNAPTVDQLKL